MDDLVKSMKAQLYDRASSPLVSTFICSWALWNYRLIIILLSSSSASDKFMQIELLPLTNHLLARQISPDYWFVMGFIIPSVFTIIYLVVLPNFEAKAYELSSRKVAKLKAIKLAAENDTPLSETESFELREQVRLAEKKREEGIEEQRRKGVEEVSNLNRQLLTAKSDLSAMQTDLKQKIDRLESQNSEYKVQAETAIEASSPSFAKIASILFLEQGARDLYKTFGPESAFPVADIQVRGNSHALWLQQLLEADLVKVQNGYASLSNLGHGLYLQRTLPHQNGPS